jgi:hypothetical protein
MTLKSWLTPVILVSFPTVAGSHPSLTPHPHTSTTVQWEFDDTKDGNSAHNHNGNRNFGGLETPSRQPYSAFACWDDTTYAYDLIGDFDFGHCYINYFALKSKRNINHALFI